VLEKVTAPARSIEWIITSDISEYVSSEVLLTLFGSALLLAIAENAQATVRIGCTRQVCFLPGSSSGTNISWRLSLSSLASMFFWSARGMASLVSGGAHPLQCQEYRCEHTTSWPASSYIQQHIALWKKQG
jgi:hypothetical protein